MSPKYISAGNEANCQQVCLMMSRVRSYGSRLKYSKIVVFLTSAQSYTFPHEKAVRRTTRSGVWISFKCGKGTLFFLRRPKNRKLLIIRLRNFDILLIATKLKMSKFDMIKPW